MQESKRQAQTSANGIIPSTFVILGLDPRIHAVRATKPATVPKAAPQCSTGRAAAAGSVPKRTRLRPSRFAA